MSEPHNKAETTVIETVTVAEPVKPQGKTKPPYKRKHNEAPREKRTPYIKKPRFEEYNKPKPETPAGYLEPIEPIRLIQISLHGLERIAKYAYDCLRFKDQRVVNDAFTRDRFVHICNLIAFYKLYYNAQQLGTYTQFDIPQNYDRISAFSGIPLPPVIVDYVNCLGLTIIDHQKFAPYPMAIHDFFNGPCNIFYMLDDNGRRIVDEEGDFVPCTVDNFIDQWPVSDYVLSSVRALSISKNFPCVNFDEKEGKPEIAISYRIIPNMQHMTQPRCFASQSVAVAQRGVCFRFWNSDEERDFGDMNLEDHFYGYAIDDSQYLANLCREFLK